MSRHHPALAVMLVVVRVTATHHTVPHLTVVRVRQLSRKAQSWAPFVIHPLVLQFIEPTERPSCSKQPESVGPVCSALWSNSVVIPNRVGFVRLSQIVDSINKIRGCKTQGSDGNLVPVAVKSTRLGGGLSVFFGCDGCKVKLESFTKYEHGPARNNDISVCVQVAFIVAGCTQNVSCCKSNGR